MAQPLTREQFRTAVADAVNGVLNVYREVDAILRELGAALAAADDELRFVPLVKRLVPAAGSKSPDARYLRNYHAAIFSPVDVSEDEDDEEEDEEDGDEDEGDAAAQPKRPLTIETGSGIVVARAAIYDRGTTGFEPNLVVGALMRCRVDADVALGTQLKVSRSRFRKLLRAIDGHRGAIGKPIHTGVPANVVGQPKHKLKLIFDLPKPLQVYPLFEVTPDKIQGIARKVREDWIAATTG
jgi:hypothetical protein